MVRESSGFSPAAVLIHLLAIAAGVYLGLLAMDAIAPDLPAESVEPGVSSSIEPSAVAGDDPDSLLLPGALEPALAQLDEQLGAGEGVQRLRIEPGGVETETGTGDGVFALSEVSPDLPERLIAGIHGRREQVTAQDVGYMELVATAEGPRWYVQLDINRTDVDPPWTYGAPLGGRPLTTGPAPPEPG